MDETLYLGIDGGGSKCHAILYRPGRGIIGAGIAGPANPLQGYERALVSIAEAASTAIHDAGLNSDTLAATVAGVGLAGLNLPGQLERMRRWQHPFGEVHLATDLEVACLGAHDGSDGAVVIAGTGSSGYVRVGEDVLILGGSGFPAGDVGGGAWFGLRALQTALQAWDGIAPGTLLCERLEAHFGTRGNAIAERLAGAPTSAYAELAPFVFDAAQQGDATAIGILEEGADYLGRMMRVLLEHEPPRLSLIGGLAPFIGGWLDEDVQACLSPPLESPAMGAVRLAMTKGRHNAAARRLARQP